jgi:rubrerythrin
MQQGSGSQGQYPVDNNTYNLIQMLASKLEAIEVYQKYQKDADQQTRGLIDQMLQQDRQHAEQLVRVLSQKLGGR